MTEAAATAPATPAAQQARGQEAGTRELNPVAGLMMASLLSLPLWGLVVALVRLVAS
jgi:hypothetical protein